MTPGHYSTGVIIRRYTVIAVMWYAVNQNFELSFIFTYIVLSRWAQA